MTGQWVSDSSDGCTQPARLSGPGINMPLLRRHLFRTKKSHSIEWLF